MSNRFTRAVVAAVALSLAPAALFAQQPGPIDPTQLPPEAQELIVELQQIQAKLGPIQQQAFQDPQIQAEQQALAADVQEAMVEVDPETPSRLTRLEALAEQAEAAQAEEDQAAMGRIVAEAQQIERHLQAAQAEAMQRPEIAPRVEDFQEKLQEKMVEVDPEAESLIERAQDLDARLGAVLGQAP